MALAEWQEEIIEKLKGLTEPPWEIWKSPTDKLPGRIRRICNDQEQCPLSAIANTIWYDISTIQNTLKLSTNQRLIAFTSADGNIFFKQYNDEFRQKMLETLGLEEKPVAIPSGI